MGFSPMHVLHLEKHANYDVQLFEYNLQRQSDTFPTKRHRLHMSKCLFYLFIGIRTWHRHEVKKGVE